MANYVPSNLNVGQASLSSIYAKHELRYAEPSVLKNLLGATEFCAPSYEALRTREDRSFTVDFFKRTSRALGTARDGEHSGVKGDTVVVTPSFATRSDKFAISIKQADASKRTLQEMFNNELQNSVINLTNGLNQEAATYVFTNRNAINTSTIGGSLNATTKAFEIATANKTTAMQTSLMQMELLRYNGIGFDVYCDSRAYAMFSYQSNQGQSNSVNLSFQFNVGRDTYYHVPEINAGVAGLAAGIYDEGFWLIVPKQSVCAMTWIPIQNRNGVSSTSIGGVAEYGNILNPIDGSQLAVHKRWARSGESSLNGQTQDVREEVELSIDIAFDKAPLSVSTETVISAFAIV